MTKIKARSERQKPSVNIPMTPEEKAWSNMQRHVLNRIGLGTHYDMTVGFREK